MYETSGVTGDCHAPFCGSPGVRFPRATRRILARQNIEDYLALPAQLTRGREVFLLRVRGNSMSGEDGVLHDDYVIVHHTRDYQDGDMVVAFVPDEDGATVKRIWRGGERDDKYVVFCAVSAERSRRCRRR